MHKIIAAIILLFSVSSHASESEMSKYINNPELVGKGKLTFYFWDVYHAELYAEDKGFYPEKPFALKLIYLRDINSEDIAKTTIEEIKKQGYTNKAKLADWYSEISRIFPDVKPDDNLTGIYIPDQEKTIFYNNGKNIGEINDAEFSKRFFDIWLSEKTSAPHLRKQLLGKN